MEKAIIAYHYINTDTLLRTEPIMWSNSRAELKEGDACNYNYGDYSDVPGAEEVGSYWVICDGQKWVNVVMLTGSGKGKHGWVYDNFVSPKKQIIE